MFRRRKELLIHQKVWTWVWPQSGWRRASKYVVHRLSRLPGTGYSIACGFAFGTAISFTPFVGLHLILSGALAWFFGGNVLAAWIGTLIGNPWTFPFIWLGIYKLGGWILTGSGEIAAPPPDFTVVFTHMWHALLNVDPVAFGDGIASVILPMTVGAIPCFIIIWTASYFPMKYLVDNYKRRRAERMLRRRNERRPAEGNREAPAP